MSIIDRYIGKHIAVTVLVVLLALLGVDVFFYLVNELRYVGKGNYDTLAALRFIALTVPRKIYILFPWAALLGALLALGNLARSSELVAMRVARVSVTRIAWSALKIGLILTTIMFLCGEVISPAAEKRAQRKKMLALSGGKAIQAHFGTWVRNGDEFIHIGKVKKPQELYHVTRYKFDDNLQLKSVTYAESLEKKDDLWHLHEVQGTNFLDNGTQAWAASERQEHAVVDESILQASTVKHLERLTIRNLYQVIQKRVSQELNALEYQRAFWTKIMQPFAALVMFFLAVPFVFGPLRSASFGLKVLVGIFVGFSFHTLNAVFGPLTAVVGISPFMASLLPILIFFTLGMGLIIRVR